jgi:hypothetical protein
MPKGALQLIKNQRFGFRIKRAMDKNQDLRREIAQYLERFDIVLPAFKKSYLQHKEQILQYDAYGEGLELELGELINLYYALDITRGFYAINKETKHIQPAFFWYSRHRLDFVWNLRKSQLIRKMWCSYLKEGKDSEGNLIIQHYTAAHLTLTVQHTKKGYKGEEFYIDQLLKDFSKLRRSTIWKVPIYGGEYGVEIKKNDVHGLHIHIHGLLFIHPQYCIHTVREKLAKRWKALTKNTAAQVTGLHLETLYHLEKDPLTGKEIKVYHENPKETDLNQMMKGVLECLKYHFEPKCLEKVIDDQNTDKPKQTHYDIDLIKQLVKNTKGARLYSRFGAFREIKELNFSKHEAEPKTDQETEEEIIATTDGLEERIIDPLTFEPLARDKYDVIICNPTVLKYHVPDKRFKTDIPEMLPYEAYYPDNWIRIKGTLSFKEIARRYIRGEIDTLAGEPVLSNERAFEHMNELINAKATNTIKLDWNTIDKDFF